ncbi:unnamed protein product [Strongylus vulgaris]|uniref:Nose resistant-to-fluoxetine protein N-terminal domain-containing protein n=1 Tax=Strongylus vulgaris TaxID=40348 RepID=A0A3P7LDN3_STRVU|nr:unnamed protein product [Strongylus vulgaris]
MCRNNAEQTLLYSQKVLPYSPPPLQVATAAVVKSKRRFWKRTCSLLRIDAFGKLPAGLLEVTLVSPGSYSECMSLVAPYDVHYCYATAKIANQTGSPIGIKMAVCMPKSCNEEDIPKVLDSIKMGGIIPLTYTSSTCVPTNVKPTTAFWIFMSFMALFIFWAVLATVVDFASDVYHMRVDREAKVTRLLLAFSIYSNGGAIFETSPHKEGSLKSLASIRFISMTWVVAGHTVGQNALAADALGPQMHLGPCSLCGIPYCPQQSQTLSSLWIPCQKYWWRNALYINNLFRNSTECYPITWYLAVDTQLFFIAPIFLVTLALWPIIGKFSAAK